MTHVIYTINLNKNQVFTTPIPHETHRTCIVACKEKSVAKLLVNHLRRAKEVELYMKEIDCMDQLFYRKLLLNNLALMLVHDFSVDVYDIDDITVTGELIRDEYEISDENRVYLDHIYDKNMFDDSLGF